MRTDFATALLVIASGGLFGPGAPASAAFPAMESFVVPLSGKAESDFAHPSGGTGDLRASGAVKLTILPIERKLCFEFSLRGADGPLMAHLHQGRVLQNGPPVVTLFTGPGAAITGCAPANTGALADIIANPANYYVSLATTEYPDGALRGQLPG